MIASYIPLDPRALAADEVPPELRLDYYVADLAAWPYAEALAGPFCWSPLEGLGDFLRQWPWPEEVQQQIASAQAAPPLAKGGLGGVRGNAIADLSYRSDPNDLAQGGPGGVHSDGAIVGHVWPAEGVVVEPYVTIRAEGGLVCLDRGARLHSFVRLEAGPGETIYIGAETVVGAGCCLQGNLCVGPGCRLIGADLRGPVQIGPETTVEHAALRGPIVIGAGCEIRPGAYLRENCLFGDHVVFRSEAKNVILLDGASDRHTAAGHYAYLGDSILGRRVNLGAGTKTANLRVDNRPVSVRVGDTRYPTGRRKFGAVLGDDVQTGCLTVCDPGTLVGPRTLVYPGAYLHGTYPPDSIVKVRQTQEVVGRRDT